MAVDVDLLFTYLLSLALWQNLRESVTSQRCKTRRLLYIGIYMFSAYCRIWLKFFKKHWAL